MDKKKVFVIMPFDDQYFEVFEMLKIKFGDSFDFSNAGEEGNQQNILKDIIQPIYEADVIIADLTGLNPNVMYELGLAHSFNKKTIIITQDELSSLPFDLKQYRAKDYSVYFKKFAELIEYLEKNLNGAADNSVVFSNPVKDFLETSDIHDCTWFSRDIEPEKVDFTEKGFIDYLAEIESNVTSLNSHICFINSEMEEMTNGISTCTNEINRVKRNGGNNVSFIRKETKKAANYIDVFSSKLRVHNSKMPELWDSIEKNTIGLLENSISSNENNREGLSNYLKEFYLLKEAVTSSAKPVSELRNALLSLTGAEHTLNHAIKYAEEDLSNYIVFTERVSSSIDKIKNKARLVIGDID